MLVSGQSCCIGLSVKPIFYQVSDRTRGISELRNEEMPKVTMQ